MLNGFQKLFNRASDKPTEEQIEYIQYAQEVETTLRILEAHLHDSDDSDEIIKNVMKAACAFYKADWAGFLEVDLDLGLWTPYVWYNTNATDKTAQLLHEFESADFLPRWVQAMQNNDAVIVKNAEDIREKYPSEFEVYKRVNIDSVLAVPVKPRPTGFLALRNPKRYITRSSMLQMFAYVLLSAINEKKLFQSLKMTISPENITHENDVIIDLFGNLAIYTSKGVLRESDLKSPRICRLLAYLLINKKVTVSPREIVEAIWPEELDEENCIKNVRALMFRLRQSFGLISEYQLVETTPNGYRFNPNLHIMTDLQQFDQNWNAVQKSMSISGKVELLKQTVELYKGDVLLSASDEHWLMPTATHYKLRYEGLVNELLRTLADQKDFHNLHKYAAQVLTVEPENLNAHYYLIYSMCNNGAGGLAKTQMEMARNSLEDEEYYELVERVKKLDFEPNSPLILNEKLSI